MGSTLASAGNSSLRRQRATHGLGVVVLGVICLGAAMTSAQETADTSSQTAAVLTNAMQVMRLSSDVVRTSAPSVRLRGVLTYQPTEKASYLFLQDESGSVQIAPTNRIGQPRIGDLIEVEGEIAVGTFSPYVHRARVERVGEATFPEPRPARAEELGTAMHHCQFIRVEGSVIDLVLEDARPTLLVSSHGITYNVYVGEINESLPWEWLDARVEMRGVLLNFADDASKPNIFRLLVASNSWVRLLETPNTNRFERPLLSARELRDRSPTNDQRIVVRGTVVHAPGTSWVVLQDETGPMVLGFINPIPTNNRSSVVVSRASPSALKAGDRIEAIGTMVSERAFSPRIDYADYRLIGRGVVPPLRHVTASQAASPSNDCQLISVDGHLVDQAHTNGRWKKTTLWVRSGESLFEANWSSTNAHPLPVERDSRVRLSGVCLPSEAGSQRIKSFELLLRSADDVVTLARPNSWLSGPALKVAALGAGLLVLALAWVAALRHRVDLRTAELARANARLHVEIDEREQAQADLKRALAAEREVGELRSRFVSLVSHEFRTPLGITMSAVELLRNYLDRLSGDKRQELMQDIYDATRRMSGLMEQVLLLGRVESGRVAFRPAPLDLEALGRALVDETLSATNRRCPVTLSTVGELHGFQADEALLRHALGNLLSNAVKYSPPGSPVEFTIRRDARQVEFIVRDRGIGIPEKDLRQLFQAFQRGSNVGDTPGTGLGLLIVKRCVELHGGSIQLESTEGAGTTFRVALPVLGEPEEQKTSLRA